MIDSSIDLLFFLGKKTKIDFVKMEKKNKSTNKLVVAIDIGTKFSGFAFSLKDDWKKVYHYNSWTDRIHITSKTPTCLLLKKDLSESFFGYEADTRGPTPKLLFLSAFRENFT